MRTHIQPYSKTTGEISLYIYTDAALFPLRPYYCYICVLILLPHTAIQVYTYIQTPLSLLCGLTILLCVLILLYMCLYMCRHIYMCLYMCRHIYYICVYICVYMCVYMCPHTAIYVSSYCYTGVLILLYMCPHTAIYVSSYCYICFLYCCICVLILLHIICPQSTLYDII